ncbi:MAG: phosphoribosylamine--glycine ligase [Spirochaetaceae bacterium]|nr:MAG: phosphoribosylamine--glycine ligase [Spirochaetaceae bacterium]
MRILIIGSGAREHAIAETLLRREVDAAEAGAEAEARERPTLYCLGTHRNPGIEALTAAPVTVGDITDPALAVETARAVGAELACIGPEAPLAGGVTDALEAAGIPVVGPRQGPARIETSKAFCRELLREVCPEATPRFFVVTTEREAESALAELGDAYVVKADGLAGGKGVKVAGDHLASSDEALAWCREILRDSPRIVIEEKLLGEEFSLLSFTDGYSCLHMPAIQDHKRAYEDDRGPNTGGMGSYTDANASLPFLGRQDVVAAQRLNERVVRGILEKTGVPYRGILYGGFMATARGIAIVEYNARFGDPEALNVLPLLQTDLLKIFLAIVSERIGEMDVRFRAAATVCKYLVPPGYPEKGERGVPVDLPVDVPEEAPDRVVTFMGSLSQREGPPLRLVTEGSRTLAVTGIAATIARAEDAAEMRIRKIVGSLTHRRDIGTEALIRRRIDHMNELRERPLRIGILGSTRGTSTEALIDATEQYQVPASIEVIISDRPRAPILERAARHRIPFHFVDPASGAPGTPDAPPVRRRREDYDRELIDLLGRYRVDLVLCVGFMRILSPLFCRHYRDRALNVHPSLLPDFAGGMDGDVHAAVIAAGRAESGCTVHYVIPEVDAGPILLRKRCPLRPDDTPETLKERVQALESEALLEAVALHHSEYGV